MMKQPKKGILKHKTGSTHSGKDLDHLKWDEETIAAQDKERGGKMKITEPKTPYNYYNSVRIFVIYRMRMKKLRMKKMKLIEMYDYF